MKILNKISVVMVLAVSLMFGLTGPITALAAGPAGVTLGSATSFAILSKAGVTNTGSQTSYIIGNMGSSPITSAAIIMFCSNVTGTIYGVDAGYVGSGNTTCFAGTPPASNKTFVDTAVLDMEAAYTDAAGRPTPTATDLGAGNIGGMMLAPGLYKWNTNVTIQTDLTLSGGANDVWIFQISGNLNVASLGSTASGVKVILTGGAQASNVFWQVGGPVGATLGTYSTFNGTILSAKQVISQTGAILYGRALAQTQVTLDASIVTIPTASTAVPIPTPIPISIPTYTPTYTPTQTMTTNVTDAGCSSGNTFSITTGNVCTSYVSTTNTTDYGCASGNRFSITTGNVCASYAPTTDAGCSSGNTFSITTGKVCPSMSYGVSSTFTRLLKVGSRGDDVTRLQERLIKEGLLNGKATGYFGSLTSEAVKKLQEKNGLEQVGVVGPQTRNILNR